MNLGLVQQAAKGGNTHKLQVRETTQLTEEN